MSPAKAFLRHPQRPRHHRSRSRLRSVLRLLRLAVVLAIPIGLGWWLMTSEQLRLTTIEAVGTPRVENAWIEARLSPEIGRNLLTLRLAAVESRVLEHPWAEAVSARKLLPDRLRVEVSEREAAAILESEGLHFYVDTEGRRIERAQGLSSGGLPILSLGVGAGSRVVDPSESQALRAALRAQESMRAEIPGWGPSERLEVLQDGSMRVYQRELPFPVLAEREGLASAMRLLAPLVPGIVSRFEDVEEVDLRVPGRIVVRPGDDLSKG